MVPPYFVHNVKEFDRESIFLMNSKWLKPKAFNMDPMGTLRLIVFGWNSTMIVQGLHLCKSH